MEDTQPSSPSNVWNESKTYVTAKIMYRLIECDSLIMTAIYGSEDLNDSYNLPKTLKDTARVEAVKRILDTLKMIIDNSYFILRAKDKIEKSEELSEIEKIEKRIEEVEEVLEGTHSIIDDPQRQIYRIEITKDNEAHLILCINTLRKIIRDLMKPLNDADLIFSSSDEIDLDEIKKQLIEGG